MIMNAAQGIEDRESKEYKYGGKNNEQNEGRQLVSDGQGKHLCRHLQHEGSTRDIISVEAKGRGGKTHIGTPTGKYSNNDSHTAKSTINPIEIKKRKEKGNNGRGFRGSVPYDGRKDHRGQQYVIMNAAQGIEDRESDKYEYRKTWAWIRVRQYDRALIT